MYLLLTFSVNGFCCYKLQVRWLNLGSNEGPHRFGNLTLPEQRTQVYSCYIYQLWLLKASKSSYVIFMKSQMTLWSMAKSPLMFGGEMRRLDRKTLELITNPILLEINSYSSNNMEVCDFTYILNSSRIRVTGKLKSLE